MKKRKEILKELKSTAPALRKDILQMIYDAASGHPGGSLSSIDILNALYNYKMNHDPKNPDWDKRDRFIMSKGHASPALYAILGNCGYFPREEFKSFRQFGGLLQGHVHRSIPGVELSTGSLGQGLSVASGMALGAKFGKKDYRIYCMIGDGEMQEGQIWEALLSAAQYKLDNLCVILDYNGIQENGPVDSIKKLEPIEPKISNLGWHFIQIDGNDYGSIVDALDEADSVDDRPVFIKANTVKGKGVSFMENKFQWHAKNPDEKQLKEALAELNIEMEAEDDR